MKIPIVPDMINKQTSYKIVINMKQQITNMKEFENVQNLILSFFVKLTLGLFFPYNINNSSECIRICTSKVYSILHILYNMQTNTEVRSL